MSGNIQPIRVAPQINSLKPNVRTGDKKDNKENKKDFSNLMSDNDMDSDGKGHDQIEVNNENTGHREQNTENPLHESDDDNFDNDCGNLLDTEL